MFMFCYFYDDDNDDLPNVLTLKKKEKCVSGLGRIGVLTSGEKCHFLGVFSV